MVRINEAFGDTVNWDLFPDIAINQVELISSSPVYGLNALGGAISVTMKNGFTYQGSDLELSGGSYQQRAITGQYGVNSGAFGFYIAGRALDWDGWRQFSNDRMRDLYAVASYHTDTATLDLSFTRALVPRLRPDRFERQHDPLRGLYEHVGNLVPAGRGHAADELGGTNAPRHLERRHTGHRRERF